MTTSRKTDNYQIKNGKSKTTKKINKNIMGKKNRQKIKGKKNKQTKQNLKANETDFNINSVKKLALPREYNIKYW